MMESIGIVINTSNMNFLDDSKQASIKNEFEALNKSVQSYFVDVSKKNNSPQNVERTKVHLIGGMTSDSDNVLVTGVLQRVESRAINSIVFQNHSKETIRSTRRLKKMVESLSTYLDENDVSILNETLDSAQMTPEILSNKLDRIERRANSADVKLGDFLIKMPKIPKSISQKNISSRYDSYVTESSMPKVNKKLKTSSESMVISYYGKHN